MALLLYFCRIMSINFAVTLISIPLIFAAREDWSEILESRQLQTGQDLGYKIGIFFEPDDWSLGDGTNLEIHSTDPPGWSSQGTITCGSPSSSGYSGSYSSSSWVYCEFYANSATVSFKSGTGVLNDPCRTPSSPYYQSNCKGKRYSISGPGFYRVGSTSQWATTLESSPLLPIICPSGFTVDPEGCFHKTPEKGAWDEGYDVCGLDAERLATTIPIGACEGAWINATSGDDCGYISGGSIAFTDCNADLSFCCYEPAECPKGSYHETAKSCSPCAAGYYGSTTGTVGSFLFRQLPSWVLLP